MSSAPLVTICIPTYERLKLLEEAVASALTQTYANVEVLISDDGTSRALSAWAERTRAEDSRIVYVRNERRLGLAGNWDACVQRARGEFLTIIGDDDRLLPTFVERMLAALDGADVAFCNHFMIDALGHQLERETAENTSIYRRNELTAGRVNDPELWVWRNSVPMSAALIRTSLGRALGFKHDLNTPELEFFARAVREAASFCFVSDYLVEVRTHAASATAAGLKLETLVRYLEPIPVAAHVEPEKRSLLERYSVAGVHRLLLAGNVEAAAMLSRSRYYPSHERFSRVSVQRLALRLPLGPAELYRALFGVGKAAARLRGVSSAGRLLRRVRRLRARGVRRAH